MINPIYCYEAGHTDLNKAVQKDKDPTSVERAAIIINRGWIPARYREKNSRPQETNSRELVRFTGVWRRGKDLHDYKVPNNPDSNEWHNLALEDIGIFWDLPNWDECKYYYFQSVDLKFTEHTTSNIETPVKPYSADEVIEDQYGWNWDQRTHKLLY